jgi:hypothetical protein
MRSLSSALIAVALLAGFTATPALHAQASRDTTVTMDASATVEVVGWSGDFTIRGVSGRTLRLRNTGDRNFEVSGDSRALRLNGSHLRGSGSVDLVLDVPRGTALLVRTQGGDINISNTGGDVEVRTTSGDINVTDAQQVFIESVSSDINLVDIADGARVNTTTGDISARNITGNLEISGTSTEVTLRDIKSRRVQVKVVSGDIAYSGALSESGRYDFSTHSGDVELSVPRDSRATLELQSFNGDVTSRNLPLTLLPEPGATSRAVVQTEAADRGNRERDSIRRQIADSMRREAQRRNRDTGSFERDFERSVERLVESVMGSIGRTMESLALQFDGLPRGGRSQRMQLGESGGPLVFVSTFSGSVTLRSNEPNDRR